MTAGVRRRDVVRPAPSTVEQVGAGLLATVAVCVAWALSLPRTVPDVAGAHGVDASVAERLLAGDRLYVGVHSDRDPLSTWLLALGRLAGPVADVVLEVGWLALACTAVLVLARRVGAGPTPSVLAGFAATPLALTGVDHRAGEPLLAATALGLAALAAAVHDRWTVSGLLTGAVVLALTAASPVAIVALAAVGVHRRAWAGPGRAALAAGTLVGVAVVVLVLRGELVGWLLALRGSVLPEGTGDASGPTAAGAGSGWLGTAASTLWGRLAPSLPEDSRGLLVLAAVVLALALLGRSAQHRPGRVAADDEPRPDDSAVLWDVTLACLVAGVGTLVLVPGRPASAATGVAVSTGLALLAARLGHRRAPAVRGAVALLLAGYLAGGALHPSAWLAAAREVGPRLTALTAVSAESHLLTQLPQVHTFARAGAGDPRASAVGLRGLHLQCPRLHQEVTDTPAELDATAACLGTADAVVVDDSLRTLEGHAAWNTYVSRVDAVVADGWTCLPTLRARVCLRPGVAG